jgi:hypothetical protein
MARNYRRERGSETQNAVRDLFRATGWPYADSAGAGRAGSDLTNTPGLAVEIKGRRDLNPTAWLRQASGNSGLPFVIWRPDGFGPATVGIWPALIRSADLITVLRLAGYGTPEKES